LLLLSNLRTFIRILEYLDSMYSGIQSSGVIERC